jgi:signal transduction histidine kinase
MTLKRLRDISAAGSAAAILLIGAALLWSAREVDQAIVTSGAADAIRGAAAELNYLAVDTILHYEARTEKQWQAKYDSLTLTLAAQRFKPAYQEFVDQIGRSHAAIGVLYPQLIKYHDAASAGAMDRASFRELEARTVSRLLGEVQEMTANALRLGEASKAEIVAAQRTLGLLILSFAFAISAIVAANWVLITRNVLAPVARLRGGTEIVAAGNLDYRMGSSHEDEIGSLARAFDAMTAKIEAATSTRKGAAEALTRRTAELEVVNRELEAFSYSVSHDLRAPLRHIGGYADMLREEFSAVLDESGKRYLATIAGAVTQMGRLIDDLLAFSKMGRAEMREDKTSMSALVAGTVDDLATEIEGRRIDWDIQPLPDVRGDRSMLKQVWVNLLSNAVKYSRPREVAKIRIGCSRNDGEYEFYVQDNGAGFDMAYADKLFGVFQRLHRTEEFEGVGVGLANVQRIVNRHGGRTWAHGKTNQGATFYFTLPDVRTGPA